MAGSRLTQAVLPWLPGGAAEIAPGVGLLTLPDGGGQIWVHGMATFTWEAGDEAGRRLAAVQVTKLKAATQKQVAAALGTDLATVWRWVSAYRENGLAGLLPARKGPKGPTKLTPELTAEINDLDARGLGLEAIASRCGVSTFAVRTALGRVPARPAPPSRPGKNASPARTPQARTAAPHARTLRTAPPHETSSSPPAAAAALARTMLPPTLRTSPQVRTAPQAGPRLPRPPAGCCRCCRTRCRGTGNASWPGSGCSARALPRYSPPAAATRWPGC